MPASSSSGFVRFRCDFRGANRGRPFVAGAVLHVGQRIGSLRAHRLVVRRLEVRDALRAICPPPASRIRAWRARPVRRPRRRQRSRVRSSPERASGAPLPACDSQRRASLLGAVIGAAHVTRNSPGVARANYLGDRAVPRDSIFELGAPPSPRSTVRCASISMFARLDQVYAALQRASHDGRGVSAEIQFSRIFRDQFCVGSIRAGADAQHAGTAIRSQERAAAKSFGDR